MTNIREWAERRSAPGIRKGAGPAAGGDAKRNLLGKTKSGKPVVASGGHADAKELVAHVENAHPAMEPADHAEAAKMHREEGKEHPGGSHARNYHEAHALSHEMVGANKALAAHFGGSAAIGLSNGVSHSDAKGAGPAEGADDGDDDEDDGAPAGGIGAVRKRVQARR
jgi:hypothetical protein